MRRIPGRLLLPGLLLLLTTAPAALTPAKADGNPTASGQVSLTIAGGLQTYAFSAIQHKDGSVSGQFTLNSRGQDVIIQGDVTCLIFLSDSEAIIGGTITHVTTNSDPVWYFLLGQPFVFRVQDNGSGANSPTNLASDVVIADCSLGYFLGMAPLEGGNVNVNP